jgi:hypothetical protein
MEKKLPLALALVQKHGASGEPAWARPWRWAKTAFFLVAMLASLLLVCAPPLLVVLLDLALPPALLSSHLRAATDPAYQSFQFLPAALDQARAFDFRSSLVDLPAVSAARAMLILCAYALCGGGGAYLWVVVASVAASASYVLAKAAAMRVAPQGVNGAAGPEPMLLLSLSLAAAHLAVAYRTSCRERRRLLVYRIDVEAVSTRSLSLHFLLCKSQSSLAEKFTFARPLFLPSRGVIRENHLGIMLG